MDRDVNVNMIGQFSLQALLQARKNFSKPCGVEPLMEVAVKTGVFDRVLGPSTGENRIAGLCVSYLLVRRSDSSKIPRPWIAQD